MADSRSPSVFGPASSVQHDEMEVSSPLKQLLRLSVTWANGHVCRRGAIKSVFYKADERYIRRLLGPKPYIDGAPMVVEFTSEVEGVQLPEPLLLALHATCARVARMSGAAEFFDQLECDAENMEVLAFDRSSFHRLGSLISPFAVIPGVA